MMAPKSLLDGKKVLIVDDEPDVLDTLEALLPMCRVEKASKYKNKVRWILFEYTDHRGCRVHRFEFGGDFGRRRS
jgi:hypoxanthine phosphoribosyltransferase